MQHTKTSQAENNSLGLLFSRVEFHAVGVTYNPGVPSFACKVVLNHVTDSLSGPYTPPDNSNYTKRLICLPAQFLYCGPLRAIHSSEPMNYTIQGMGVDYFVCNSEYMI